MLGEHTLVRTTSGEFRYAGIDMGGLGALVAKDGPIIVIKWPSHHYWLGIGMPRAYASPQMQVVRLVGNWRKGRYQHIRNSDKSVKVQVLIEWNVTRKKS